MQVATLVRRTLALDAHRVVSVTRPSGTIVVELELVARRLLPCSACGRPGRMRDRRPQRRWRHLPVWKIPVELCYRPARVACTNCATPKIEAIPWAMGKSTLSRPLIVELATWSRLLAWDVVARLHGVSWATVVQAVEHAVAYGLAHRNLDGLGTIGIDELSRRKGHVYHTNVYDIGSSPRRLIWSGQDRTKATLRRFFDDIGPERAQQLEAVCCDIVGQLRRRRHRTGPASQAGVRQVPHRQAPQRRGLIRTGFGGDSVHWIPTGRLVSACRS